MSLHDTITLIGDNGYDGYDVLEFSKDEFWSIVKTGRYGIIGAHDIQRDILNGRFDVIEGREITMSEIKACEPIGDSP